jgi:hypothetical protein
MLSAWMPLTLIVVHTWMEDAVVLVSDAFPLVFVVMINKIVLLLSKSLISVETLPKPALSNAQENISVDLDTAVII